MNSVEQEENIQELEGASNEAFEEGIIHERERILKIINSSEITLTKSLIIADDEGNERSSFGLKLTIGVLKIIEKEIQK